MDQLEPSKMAFIILTSVIDGNTWTDTHKHPHDTLTYLLNVCRWRQGEVDSIDVEGESRQAVDLVTVHCVLHQQTIHRHE